MDLDEYIKDGDPNKFWRLSDGDRVNLVDDAIDRIEQLQKENKDLRESKANLKVSLREAARSNWSKSEKITKLQKENEELLKINQEITMPGPGKD